MLHLYEDIKILKKSHPLALEVYRVTKTFPTEEMYGLVSQMRRSATSISANICEGKGRGSDKEMIRYLLISRASLYELSYYSMMSRDLAYVSEENYKRLLDMADEVGRMISGMIEYLKTQVSTVSRKSAVSSRLKSKV